MEFKSYRVELHTCECLNQTGVWLGGYKLPKIPEMPLYPNPDYRWDDSWNLPDIPFEDLPTTFVSEEGGHHYIDKKGRSYERLSSWVDAVEEHLKYLSDEWPYKCTKCGKKWRGYESLGDEIIVDGVSYCRRCSGVYDTATMTIRNDLDFILDGCNLSTLYIQDNPPKYYTSLASFLKDRQLSLEDVDLVHHPSKSGGYGWNALSGHISGDHWEIRPKKAICVGLEMGFIFNIPEADQKTYYNLGKEKQEMKE